MPLNGTVFRKQAIVVKCAHFDRSSLAPVSFHNIEVGVTCIVGLNTQVSTVILLGVRILTMGEKINKHRMGKGKLSLYLVGISYVNRKQQFFRKCQLHQFTQFIGY